MNENINLCEILKDCPKGRKLYSIVVGEVEFVKIDNGKSLCPIVVYNDKIGLYFTYTKEGFYYAQSNGGECLLFPSKYQRDWSKWKCSKSKFDPNTLLPFDKIIVRDNSVESWSAAQFSHIVYNHSNYDLDGSIIATTGGSDFSYCIPFNDETKHFIGTTDEAPEYYRYWDD